MTPARSPRPAHAPRLDLGETRRLGEALATTLHTCTHQVRANIAGARLGRNAESLHQLRVGLRRLRAALPVYGQAIPAALRRDWGVELKRFEHEVGGARDWDVLTGEIGLAAADGVGSDNLALLLQEARAKQAESHRHARRVLGAPRILRLMSEIDHHADRQGRMVPGPARQAREQPLKPFARALLRTRHRKVTRAGRAIRELDASELHKLRIRIKKLRYAAEFFAGLWPKADTTPYLTALRKLQDELGLIQDAASGSALLREMETGKLACPQPSLLHMDKWMEKRRAQARHLLGRRWRTFEAVEKFWKDDAA